MEEILNKILQQKRTYQGLASADARALLEKHGLNQRPQKKDGGWFKRALKVFTEPMMLLLIITGIVYIILGDKIEALIVWLSVIPIGMIEFFEEKKTSEAIAVLDKMAVQYAKVYRDGAPTDIEFKYIVPGDLIYVTAGDQVSADGYLLRSSGLSLDESVLTGESLSVTKSEVADQLSSQRKLGSNMGDKIPALSLRTLPSVLYDVGRAGMTDENKLQQGTLVVQGEGYMLVTATGASTAYGQLGSLLEKIIKADTPLQKKIHRLVRVVAIVAISTATLVGVLLSLYHGWSEGVLGGLTVAMSLIPEEFPVVFSVFLILGMWRLSREKALVREMVMVETLGSATVICTDKTGTLTEGRMALEKIFYNGKIYDCHSREGGNPQLSFPRRRESTVANYRWIPVYTGMTILISPTS